MVRLVINNIFKIVIVVGLLLISAAPSSQSVLAPLGDTAAHRVPLIASTSVVPPYIDQEAGEISGFAIDIVREIERRLKLRPIDIQLQPWKRALRWAEVGTSDFVFMSGPDPVREQWGDYMSVPIVVERYQLYRLKDKAITLSHDYRQAERYRIGTELGCLYGRGLLRDAIDRKFSRNTVSTDTLSNLKMLLSGRVDVIAADELKMQWALGKIGVAGKVAAVSFEDYSDAVVLEWPTYIVFSKKREHQHLKRQFEKALEAIKSDGSYQRILNRYVAGDK